VAGSDAHRLASFGGALDEAYVALRAAGFDRLAFRRGGDPLEIELDVPAGAAAGPAR
jgi:hypothetical protein